MLAILCVFTVFGTGFALWSFDTQSSATRNMGVRVTQSTMLGIFEAPEITHVVLDGGTGSGINPTITGVSFYKDDGSGKAVTDNSFTVSFTVSEAYREGLIANDVRFGIRVNVPEELKELISHADFYNERVGDNGYIDLKALTIELTDHFSDSDSTNSDFKYDDKTYTFTFALNTTTLNRFFTYSATKEPTSLEKYQNLGKNLAPLFIIELWQGYAKTA